MRISDWSSDVCSSDLVGSDALTKALEPAAGAGRIDLRGLASSRFRKLLGNRGGKGIDGRGSHRADIVARVAARRSLVLAGRQEEGGSRNARNQDGFVHQDRTSTRLNSSH